jgi:hypothetical protein
MPVAPFERNQRGSRYSAGEFRAMAGRDDLILPVIKDHRRRTDRIQNGAHADVHVARMTSDPPSDTPKMAA